MDGRGLLSAPMQTNERKNNEKIFSKKSKIAVDKCVPMLYSVHRPVRNTGNQKQGNKAHARLERACMTT